MGKKFTQFWIVKILKHYLILLKLNKNFIDTDESQYSDGLMAISVYDSLNQVFSCTE